MRLGNTLRNLAWNFILQLTLIITGLLLKKILLDTIGTEKVGLNYVFNDIVCLLSIADMGLTGVVAYHLYEPLVRKDELQIIKIMQFFRKAYAVIGCSVMAVGIAILPFLGLIIGSTTIDYRYIYIIFLLFLLRNVEAYFFSYKTILPFADQKSYIAIAIDTITTILHSVISVFILLYTKNYIYVLALEIIKKMINDFIMIHIVNKKYPYIKTWKKVHLDRSEIKKIGLNIRQGFMGKASDMVISTSDNIIMTMFLGLRMTGLFSNYALVIYTIQTMLRQLVASAQASIGNLLITENKETVYSVIKKMTYISFFVASFCGCCLAQLTTPFVSMYFGAEYRLGRAVVIVCVFNIFLDIVQKAMLQLADAGGLFRQTKKINLISCGINVILSLVGVRVLGIMGILLGTLISRTIEFILRIKSNFKLILNVSCRNYLFKVIVYICIFALEIGITGALSYYVRLDNQVLHFTALGLISALLPLVLNTLIYRCTDEFSYMKDILRSLLKKGNIKM